MNRIIAAAAAGALAFAAIPTATAQEADLPEQTTDARGEVFYLNEERTHYVRELQQAAQPYAQLNTDQQEKAVAVADAAIAGLIDAGVIHGGPAPEQYDAPKEEVFGPEDVDPADPAPVASGFVKFPPVLTINDKAWFLNKDGHTFVADVARVTADPTPEEKAASKALIEQNESEVGRQAMQAARAAGEAPADQAPAQAPADEVAKPVEVSPVASASNVPVAEVRGMAAETGSNTLMRALTALLVASVLGAAFFFLGRRQLV